MELFSDNKIDELEKKIEMLIKNYKTFKEEKEQLSAKLQAMESENRELKKRLDETANERKLVLEKVMGILEKVESVDF
ncbi:MAG TPA: cell division protein ZapB [Syntrophorhabdaceae bacterium]|nr:cell division protein ZapB [Syntrophorhabdaceae bacterium]HOT42940.1 cell division protein ZapB [Syntrophorhabdaceae bacterium]HPC66587.1 cell division protein ZapB [Syntrophorhabdaceae bacterium]HQE80044.1 cell division protein ZapB [Syntrophorhabdaceae bacterium]HQH43914.1 cell division protein ZapB [Syntrophorhabdaceae bacterium]